jgi:DNA-binding protein HU-alpha
MAPTKTTTTTRRKVSTTGRASATPSTGTPRGKPAATKSAATKSAATKPTAKAASTAKASVRKPAAAPKPEAAPAAAEAPKAAEVATPTVNVDDRFRRQDLYKRVADRSSMKRSDVKEVIDLVLEELGKAVDADDELVLQPLGKVMVKQRKDTQNGAQLTVKLKRPGANAK